MRIVMMGTGPFAVPSFQALLDGPHDVVALFTQPIRPTRGKKNKPETPMRDVATSHQLPIFDPPSINTDDALQTLRKFDPDLLVVCDYGQILSRESLALAKHGGINLHGSILPKYRGAAPVNWAIYNGDTETGITVIHMTPQLDGGPCLKIVKTPIDPDETAIDLEKRLSAMGVPAVLESIEMLESTESGQLVGQIQDALSASKAPRLKKTDADIDWQRTARQIYDQFRAFQPWPGCYTHLVRDDKPPMRIILSEIRPVLEIQSSPGEIQQRSDELIVGTSEGAIAVQKLQPAGKKIMQAAEFIRGYQPNPGDRAVSESQLPTGD